MQTSFHCSPRRPPPKIKSLPVGRLVAVGWLVGYNANNQKENKVELNQTKIDVSDRVKLATVDKKRAIFSALMEVKDERSHPGWSESPWVRSELVLVGLIHEEKSIPVQCGAKSSVAK